MKSVEAGEKPPRLRPARDEDRFLVAKSVAIELPPIVDGEGEGHACRCLWKVKSKDIHIELTNENVAHVLASLACSPPAEKKRKEKPIKASPKRRRRVKRRVSEEMPVAEASGNDEPEAAG